MYLSIDIEYEGMIRKENTCKINSEMLRTAGIQCVCVAMAQWINWPTYVSLVLTGGPYDGHLMAALEGTQSDDPSWPDNAENMQ